ncbi:MAG: nucleotidyltransferase domain-containing protein [Acidimicrobiia bacterium]
MTSSIASALFGQTRRKVLALLVGHSVESFYLREIVRAIGGGTGAVQRELEQLTSAGLILRKADGRQIYFTANPDSPVFEEVRGLVTKTIGVHEVIRLALADFPERRLILSAFIYGSAYGSAATGRDRPESDVDLMVVGDLTLSALLPVLRPVQDQLGREITPTIYPVEELRQKLVAGNHFLKSVLSRPKIMLVGNENELAELAGQRLDRGT